MIIAQAYFNNNLQTSSIPILNIPLYLKDNSNNYIDFTSSVFYPTSANPIALQIVGLQLTAGYNETFTETAINSNSNNNMFQFSSPPPSVMINFLADTSGRTPFQNLIPGKYSFVLTIPNQSTQERFVYRDMLVLTN